MSRSGHGKEKGGNKGKENYHCLSRNQYKASLIPLRKAKYSMLTYFRCIIVSTYKILLLTAKWKTGGFLQNMALIEASQGFLED